MDMGRCVPPCPTLRYPLVLFTGDSHRRINAGIQQFNPRYNSRKLSLFADAFVAIDGSKFKAVNNRDRNFTKAKLKGRLRQIDQSIERYLGQLESADRHPDELTAA